MESLTLLQLNKRIASLVMTGATQNVWITAELSDVIVRGGHCYMELLQKDSASGATVAKARGAIWANRFVDIRQSFMAATGQDFRTGLKVMLCASVSMHPVYGMSLVINAVNPEYTLGDVVRRRNEMLARLKSEGIINMNRELPWPVPALRIAVVSAEGAAGYGDFMNQLHNNTLRLRFVTRLFPAMMQGDRVAPTVIAALDEIAASHDDWDCVVIIRGGGATGDLLGFENYDLAANVAQFPLPVIVGIGHERDVTILDYVAGVRVKTPTAAAEWLIERGKTELERLGVIGREIVRLAGDRLSGAKEQLGRLEGALPSLPSAVIDRQRGKLDRCMMWVGQLSDRRIRPQLSRLDTVASSLPVLLAAVMERRRSRLQSLGEMLDMLSPEATLRRGYSVTRYNGHAVTDASEVPDGAVLETLVASGTIRSVKQ